MSSDREVLEKAATILRENAECLRMCHTTPPTFALATMDSDVRSDYDEGVALASALETMAQRCGEPVWWVNPQTFKDRGVGRTMTIGVSLCTVRDEFTGKTMPLYAAPPAKEE